MEISDFGEIKKQLDARQIAVLDFVIALDELQKGTNNGTEKTVISFDQGDTTTTILQDVLEGDFGKLPVPPNDPNLGWATMSWIKTREVSVKGYPEEQTIAGSGDIRIFSINNKLILRVNNLGSIEPMRSDVESVLDNVQYPMSISDKKGFSFDNVFCDSKK